MAKRRKKTKKRRNPKRSSLKKQIKRGFFGFFAFLKKQIFNLPGMLKRYVLSSLMLLIALISFLSFFGLSGKGGKFLKDFSFYWIGNTFYVIPLIFVLWAITFLIVPKRFLGAGLLGGLAFLLGVSGIFSLEESILGSGGKLGDFLSPPLKNLFGDLVAFFVFFIFIILGPLTFWYLLSHYWAGKEEKETVFSQVIKRVRAFPKFKVLKVESEEETSRESGQAPLKRPELQRPSVFQFAPPPLELLAQESEKAHSGNIKQNALLIKKTLENFGIDVSMTEVNVGPTVAQYTFKPAEGVRLSKITALSNNLALALAAHPIRIEAPIPGKSLVGIEIPNKVRSKVRLRDLLGFPDFKKSPSNLTFALGRDVSGTPLFGDLARLPHLLVAGATGTGKTIFLNSLILSLLYQNSPATLRLVLADPKRVEFPIYNDLPHLLCPVIFDAGRTVNALKWLIEEMERRFEILSESRVKDIASFNDWSLKKGTEPLPYIILIIDELADLMAAKGKEIEAQIIRIAQMARAVGIHLVVATQRPSVEVITGLIKANITSRVSFQVATQFDARTILDMAGAEKLLGLGDMLYISAERVKPKRIQGVYVSEKEVKRVVNWIKENSIPVIPRENELFQSLREFQEDILSGSEGGRVFNDALYEEAKEIVIRSQKASASLLQRRLRIGYARAARLLDTLEAKGVIGPSQGAKPRKVYFKPTDDDEFFG